MLNHSFVKIITFILISSLFFSPSVYANMQVMSEDDLTRIDAETGITIVLNTDVYLKAASVGLYTTLGETSGILLSNLIIDNSATGGTYATPVTFNINSTVELDVGTSGGRTWLNISGENIYNPIGITSTGLGIRDSVGGDKTLGDLYIRGLFMGRTLIGAADGTATAGYSGNHTFTMGESPFIRVSGHSGTGTTGIDLFASMNLYVDTLELRYKPADSTNEFKVTGIYFCNTGAGTPETPSTWVPSGNFAIGLYDPPLYNISGETDYPASIDVGTASGKTYLSLNLPMSGTIGVKEFKMDNNADHNFGPILISNFVFKTLNITLSSY